MLLPDHETQSDYLNCEAISQTVVELLRGNRTRPLTVGIHGDWGAGKSSVLKMIEARLGADAKVAVLWFNGWTFEGFDDAKTVLNREHDQRAAPPEVDIRQGQGESEQAPEKGELA